MSVALVVEDDAALRIIYNRILTQLGFDVIAVDTAIDGIEQLHAVAPDILFLDMRLPGSLDGNDVLNFILDHPDLHYLPIVVVSTNHHSFNGATSSLNLSFVQKPILPKDIKNLAQQVLPSRAC
ncbi:MAG: response regulator [Chloroflexi bacterium]|nr:MAG: response regulator [Chloroflexota bacterium]